MTQIELQKESEPDPYIMFEYTIRSPYTKESYFRRLRRFFNAISLEGPTFESNCNFFAKRGQQDPKWAFCSILKFVLAEKQRVERREITGGTLRNSVKTIKTFCEVTDVMIPWKKITRGLPRVNISVETPLSPALNRAISASIKVGVTYCPLIPNRTEYADKSISIRN